jgi:acyl dehydratase
MSSQVYFEDVQESQEIPTLRQNCDSQRLVMWAAGSGDFYQIHYDKDFAQGNNLPDRIVHGALKHALLGRLLHEWVGDQGWVKRVTCQYRGMDMVEEDVICHGRITNKSQHGGENIVELEVWTENPKGQKTTPGTGVVSLPSRKQ